MLSTFKHSVYKCGTEVTPDFALVRFGIAFLLDKTHYTILMKVTQLLLAAGIGANAYRLSFLQQFEYNPLPNKPDAARVARTLVQRESLMNINTNEKTEKEGVIENIPVSSMEYYADCDGDGDPYWLVVDIGSTYKHIESGSPYSFTIRAGDHPSNDRASMVYPGGIVNSPAGSPRINMKGQLKNITLENTEEILRLETCFVKRHPDAKWWLPSNVVSPHKTHWVKIMVDEVYMIGGFGDRAYIGLIDGSTYHEAKSLD